LDLTAALSQALALRNLATRGLEPAPVVGLKATREREAAREAGRALLAEGRVAALVVAGGQGTRLGHAGPKGTFPLGPVSGRTLFGLQAERLRGSQRRTGKVVPWIVMTSADTDAATRAFFAAEGCFGLEVHFIRQRLCGFLFWGGRRRPAAHGRGVTAPDGHGGMLAALVESGLLESLLTRGFRALAYQQVDNPLARSADPELLGWLATGVAEVASKVVRKSRPDERIGNVTLRNGRVHVVEYTELDAAEASLRTANGGLRLWAGAIGIHAFALEFLQRCAPRADALLPLHASAKTIPHVGPDGVAVAPSEPNGYKLERFIFDLLPEARSAVLVEALREDEYAPVKNAHGSESPASARSALSECARRWLEGAGFRLPSPPCWIELDHALIDSPEEAASRTVRDASAAGSGVRVGTGVCQ
jgi:UDP-N-acetylglucosamine/UDP-N-acetylgalactosamine diphosphorylase